MDMKLELVVIPSRIWTEPRCSTPTSSASIWTTNILSRAPPSGPVGPAQAGGAADHSDCCRRSRDAAPTTTQAKPSPASPAPLPVMRRILVTGASGGIGRATAAHQQAMVETGGYGLDVLVNAAGILSSAPWRPSPASRPGRSALRGLRRRASPPLVAGCGEVRGASTPSTSWCPSNATSRTIVPCASAPNPICDGD